MLYIACLILSLHNISAHSHSIDENGESKTTFFVKNDFLKNVLEFVFNPDFGDGHLENIQSEDKLEVSFDITEFQDFAYNNFEWNPVFKPTLHNTSQTFTLDFKYRSTNYGLIAWERGPPRFNS